MPSQYLADWADTDVDAKGGKQVKDFFTDVNNLLGSKSTYCMIRTAYTVQFTVLFWGTECHKLSAENNYRWGNYVKWFIIC